MINACFNEHRSMPFCVLSDNALWMVVHIPMDTRLNVTDKSDSQKMKK